MINKHVFKKVMQLKCRNYNKKIHLQPLSLGSSFQIIFDRKSQLVDKLIPIYLIPNPCGYFRWNATRCKKCLLHS